MKIELSSTARIVIDTGTVDKNGTTVINYRMDKALYSAKNVKLGWKEGKTTSIPLTGK